MTTLFRFLLAAIALTASIAFADDALLKPFLLFSNGPGTISDKSAAAESALAAQGFAVAGRYEPYPGALILVVTSPELLSNAAASEHGGFGAAQRVAFTQAGRDIQVSATNPRYMAQAYRMKGDLGGVADKLAAALGKGEPFGAKGLTAEQLRRYHYMFGMEYFTDPSVLGHFPSHEAALAAVEKGLAAHRTGVTRVARVDVPGGQETLFAVGMKAPEGGSKYMDDRFIMSEIDFRDVKSTAHLPYELLVSGNDVLALYARFRIAIDFPDLAMVGANSFVNIMQTPGAIETALKETVSP